MTNVHGDLNEVQDAISVVQGVVTDHGRKINVAQIVIEEGQV